jgi:hypothetical protein
MRKAYLSVISVVLTFWAAGDRLRRCRAHQRSHPGVSGLPQRFIIQASLPTGKRADTRGLLPKRPWWSRIYSGGCPAINVPETLQATSVGCAECHTLRGGAHADTFEHNGHEIHVVVSPDDCATCHATEREQYSKNIMAMAEKNLAENKLVRRSAAHHFRGRPRRRRIGSTFTPANDMTRADACYYCHGTRLKVTGTETRDTDVG